MNAKTKFTTLNYVARVYQPTGFGFKKKIHQRPQPLLGHFIPFLCLFKIDYFSHRVDGPHKNITTKHRESTSAYGCIFEIHTRK